MKTTLKFVVSLLILLGTLATHASAQQRQPPPDLPPPPAPPQGTTIHRDVAYVPNGHPRQMLDRYLP